MADYRYISTWQLQAPIEQVWAALSDLEHLPTWYTGVQEARELAPGDADGVGRRVRYVIKGRLPMRLAFEGTTTRSVSRPGSGDQQPGPPQPQLHHGGANPVDRGKPGSNPRPSDYESDAPRRPGRLQTDLACSRWMPRRSKRLPTAPERSSG
jgi:Polyketide cyclase / dehydrase and lipid transport